MKLGDIIANDYQHVHRAMVILTPQMMERHADLQNPLVETPYVTRFSPPELLQRLVLLEVLTAVELGNPLQQQGRWRFVTCRHRVLAGDRSRAPSLGA